MNHQCFFVDLNCTEMQNGEKGERIIIDFLLISLPTATRYDYSTPLLHMHGTR